MKPSESELRTLYVDQRLSTRAIADRFDVRHISVRRWVREHDIQARPIGRGLANRGVASPGRDELNRLVHVEHRSYAEIATLYNVDQTAVPYWLKKHNIPKPQRWATRRKGHLVLPPVKELAALYEAGMSTEEVAATHGVSGSAIQRLFKLSGIPLRPSGFNGGQRFIGSDGHNVRSTYEQRVCDYLSANEVPHEYEHRLPFDRRLQADFLAGGYYVEIWGVIGSYLYSQRRERKVTAYRSHDLPLIEIAVHAFNAQHKQLWQRLLLPCVTASRSASSPSGTAV